jgi:hypothetical protein
MIYSKKFIPSYEVLKHAKIPAQKIDFNQNLRLNPGHGGKILDLG